MDDKKSFMQAALTVSKTFGKRVPAVSFADWDYYHFG
jgi:hypothetical protein